MQLPAGGLFSSHEGSIAVFPPGAVSVACLGPMVSLAGSYVTHLSVTEEVLGNVAKLALGCAGTRHYVS